MLKPTAFLICVCCVILVMYVWRLVSNFCKLATKHKNRLKENKKLFASLSLGEKTNRDRYFRCSKLGFVKHNYQRLNKITNNYP